MIRNPHRNNRQQGKPVKRAEWIRREALSRADAYVCSLCMSSFPEPYEICPACGAIMKKIDLSIVSKGRFS